MSDDPREPEITRDEAELLELLDRLGPDSQSADRATVEALGLLPYALEETAPRPEVKAGLMARLESSAVPRSVEGAPSTAGRLVTLERRTRWFLPLAAMLAIALLGIAGLQFRRLEGQQQTIEKLTAQLERVESNGAELAEIRRVLAETDARLRMMTTRGAEFCVLKPVGDDPRFAAATATMVIGPGRDEWFLAAEGLMPCEGDDCYQLWFLTEGGSVAATAFGAGESDRRIEIGGREDVPSGVRAISITREGSPDSQEPPVTVLLADQAMTLL